MSFEVSILMPCLNEELTLARCIKKAQGWLSANDVNGEVIVADNGSTDSSLKIAEECGARIVHVRERGYGAALYQGLLAAQGRYIIFGDADDSYDFSDLNEFLKQLRLGCDLVMGNRFEGGIEQGAMPWKNRYIGNPLLSAVGRLFFDAKVKDFHCGLRGVSKYAFTQMQLKTTGMEFASEMVIKASIAGMSIAEVPTTLSVDGRKRAPHLRPWRDGWRHLRFMLLYSPKWLFWYPGMVLFCVSFFITLWIATGAKTVLGITFDIHTMLYGLVGAIVGYQASTFGLLIRKFSIRLGILPNSVGVAALGRFLSLERLLVLGSSLALLGVAGLAYSAYSWAIQGFSNLVPAMTMKVAIPSAMFSILGLQTVLFAFCMGFVDLDVRSEDG